MVHSLFVKYQEINNRLYCDLILILISIYLLSTNIASIEHFIKIQV